MPAAASSRKYAIAAASVVVHGVLLTGVALHAPYLRVPPQESGPPEAVIPVLILPRAPPPAAGPAAQPTQIRLHRRRQPFADDLPPVAPLVVPTESKPVADAAPRTSGPRVLTLPSQEDALAANARNALRGRLDCNDPRLSRAERDACIDRLGAAGRNAPVLGLGVDRDKATALEAAARRKEQDYGYKRSTPVGSGASGTGRNAGAIERPGNPNMGMGATGEDLGRTTGNDSRREAKVPF